MNNLFVRVLILGVLAFSVTAFAQPACGTLATPAPCPDDSYQLIYAANLPGLNPVPSSGLGLSIIDATNNGATAANTGLTGFSGGNLCINYYVFDPSEEMLDCCSCLLTPNGLISTDVHSLLSFDLTPEVPTSAIVKVLATNANGLTNCIGSAQNVTSTSPGVTNNLASGARLWATTLHSANGAAGGVTYGVEREFARAGSELSQGEFDRLVNTCAFITADGSGNGICKGCVSTGGL